MGGHSAQTDTKTDDSPLFVEGVVCCGMAHLWRIPAKYVDLFNVSMIGLVVILNTPYAVFRALDWLLHHRMHGAAYKPRLSDTYQLAPWRVSMASTPFHMTSSLFRTIY
jgi:hypothetical protein